MLSGNRNFEGRVNPDTRANYLASPPLVVAYALAGRMDWDPYTEPIADGTDGPVFLRDIWPSQAEVRIAIRSSVRSEMFHAPVRRRLQGRRALAYARYADRRSLRLGPVLDLRQESRPTSTA